MNIIIIANGLFPSGEWVDGLLRQADRIVCCDGALEKYLGWHCRQTGLTTTTIDIVGDGDSLDTTLFENAERAGIEVRHHLVSEQEYNDLTKATRYALASALEAGHTYKEIEIDYIGATGLREDHTLGNISLMSWYMEQYQGVRIRMLSDYGVFVPVHGHGVLATKEGQQVSLFSLTPEVPVTVKGLRWPIENRRISWWWEASLNEALGDSFEVWGGRVVVYLVSKA